METLIVPDTVETIGTYAFYYNPNLTSITILDSVTSLEEGAFAECTSLEKITLPESLNTISDTAFYNCSGFTIYTPKGSYAETYAIEKGYSYVN